MHSLVLGGGFAGVEAAIRLRKYGYEVTLISEREYLFIYPVSIWIPVEKRSFERTKISLSKLSQRHGFKVVIDKVTKIEASKNTVVTANQSFVYDPAVSQI